MNLQSNTSFSIMEQVFHLSPEEQNDFYSKNEIYMWNFFFFNSYVEYIKLQYKKDFLLFFFKCHVY